MTTKCNRRSLPNIKKQVKAEASAFQEARSTGQFHAPKSFNLSCSLSKTGLCAIMKTYEDEMYKQLKIRNPRQNLPRITTAAFNASSRAQKVANSHSDPNECKSSRSSLASNESNEDEERADAERLLKEAVPLESLVNRQVEKAMKILNELGECKYYHHHNAHNYEDLNRNSLNVCDDNTSNETSFAVPDDEFNTIAKKYESWHLKWSRMLDKFF
jgi:hypothetical protein